jgi:hypothetical protein
MLTPQATNIYKLLKYNALAFYLKFKNLTSKKTLINVYL